MTLVVYRNGTIERVLSVEGRFLSAAQVEALADAMNDRSARIDIDFAPVRRSRSG